MPLDNPLLDFSGFPRFADVQASHVQPAIAQLLEQAQTALEQAVHPDTPATYAALSALLDVAIEKLSRAWGVVNHLHSVNDSPELRTAYTDALPAVTAFYTRVGQDERLYAKYKAVSQHSPDLDAAQRKALDNALRDFVLSGAELQGSAKTRFAEIQAQLAEWQQKFSEHVLDATDGFMTLAALDEVKGIPEDVLQTAQELAEKNGHKGQYQFSLQFPSYFPVMQYAEHRPLRERMYRAYATRASEWGPADWDNSAAMTHILQLRAERAQLLGMAHHAQLSLVPKMAQSPAEVMAFLHELSDKARPFAEKDLQELRDFASQHLDLQDLQAWDTAFVSEKLKEARYAFSDQEVKAYFTETRVLEGLFKIIETLFEVHIKPDSAQTWHPAVRFFKIERAGQTIAHFYLDPQARSGKRPGAWMDDVRGRWQRPDGQLQTPVAHLVCNFAAGVGGKPALLTHDDVITLFHEFGHGLHHMLTQVNELSVSGISGVEWDAVELPSQFMENFCWEWEVLQHMTAHVDTGEALPRALFDKMLAAKNFLSGLQTLRQIEFAWFDMQLHSRTAQESMSASEVQACLNEVRKQVAVMPAPEFNRMQHSFSHIFAGGYSAGYYSYKWAEVLSADAYSAFEEAGPQAQTEMGRRYRKEILEAGGSRPAMASFKAFRGRAPRIDALLRHQGMSL